MSSIYMGLTLPTTSVTLGPLWASEIVAAFNEVDAHDHTSNKGKQVPTSGLNINADLDFHYLSPINLLSAKFQSQPAALSGSSYVSSLSVVNGNLYFTNGAGTPVQVTSGGTVVSVPGTVNTFGLTSISGDTTIAAGDTFSIVLVTTTNNVNITLPSAAAVSAGRIYLIKDVSGNALAKPIVLTRDGSDTIDKQTTYSMSSQYGCTMITSDGISNWTIL